MERIHQLENSIREREAAADSISISYEGTPHGTKISDRTGTIAAELADQKDRRLEMIAEAWKIRDEVETVILSVEDPIRSRVLYDRYVQLMTWDEIAEDIHYSREHVISVIHSRALQDVGELLTESYYDHMIYCRRQKTGSDNIIHN